MSIIAKISGMLVKTLAEASVGRAVESVVTGVIEGTGVLSNATRTTKMVVKAGTTVTGLAVGSVVVNKLIDTANEGGAPIVGNKSFNVVEATYTHNGVLVGTPEHKKKKEVKGDNVITVEVVGEGPD